MTVSVYVYDEKCRVLPVSLTLIATDANGVVLATGATAPNGRKCGGMLAWPAPSGSASNVCCLIISDAKMAYSGHFVGELNGDASPVIEAVIRHFGVGCNQFTGTRPPSLKAVLPFIGSQTSWGDSGRAAVRQLVTAYSQARAVAASATVQSVLTQWGKRLDVLGISPALWEEFAELRAMVAAG